MTRLQPLCFRPENEQQQRDLEVLAFAQDMTVSEVLREVVRNAVEGGYSDTIAYWAADYDQAQQAAPDPPAEPPETGDLTPREAEAVRLTAGGLTNARIGKRMGIAEATVGNYLSIAMGKLGLHNRAQLALYATREGLSIMDANALQKGQ